MSEGLMLPAHPQAVLVLWEVVRKSQESQGTRLRPHTAAQGPVGSERPLLQGRGLLCHR